MQVGKLEEICDIGEDVDVLRRHGILVDAEADPGDSGQQSNLRYSVMIHQLKHFTALK